MPRSQSHVAIFIVSGLGLAFAQLHRQIYYYGWNGLDVPMNLMFNFCRVSSLACCIRDGHYMTKAEKDGKEPDLKPREKAFAIKEIPSFFDFMSYLYYCGAAISGPWYEYKDFMDMIHQRGDFKSIPSTIKPGLIRFAHAWILVATGAILAQFVDEKLALTDEFVNDYSLARKWWNLYLILKMIMQTYLVGWTLTECGPIASGLAFNGYDKETGKPKFDRVQSAVLWNLEFSYSVKDFLASWNMSVPKWLKHYVFLRILPNDKRKNLNAKAAFITFLVSAVWHGFYPGFYLFFSGAFLLDLHSKLCGKVISPIV